MPLERGSSPTELSDNIKTEVAAGKAQRRAVAIAESTADSAVSTAPARGGEGHRLAGKSHAADSRRDLGRRIKD
jgi:hypothetical protein